MPPAKVPTTAHVFGVVSLTFWALMMIISLKYVAIVLRADNDGEGGILALSSLVERHDAAAHGAKLSIVVLLGIIGAALLYGDGVITPAISVLSAIEGIKWSALNAANFVVPVTLVILVGLFALQYRGTGSVGRLFGPVMVVWFVVIGGSWRRQYLGGTGDPPGDSIRSKRSFPGDGESVHALPRARRRVPGLDRRRGALCRHGPCRPSRDPAGMVRAGPSGAGPLNYFGQGALVLVDPKAIENPFYSLAPGWALIPMVVLAALATIIASQALISGVFSMTRQAIQMGLCPRSRIIPTSSERPAKFTFPPQTGC